MKVWIDVLTPKQVLFFEPMARALRARRHDVLCTSRRYGEASRLAAIRGMDLVTVGRHGGGRRRDKLRASIDRMGRLSTVVEEHSPDVAVSFCSPEAARVAFGLGIRHVAFYDGPHADAMLRLTVPLVQKLLIPGLIPKAEFARYGIAKSDIIPYNAIDAGITIRRRAVRSGPLPFRDPARRNILIRAVEEEASYAESLGERQRDIAVPIAERITEMHGAQNIVVLGRYPQQVRRLRAAVGRKARVVRMSFDGKYLLENTDVFIGSGGTMTAEAALMGVPTVSYNAVPNVVEDHLVKKRLVRRLTDPAQIAVYVGRVIGPVRGAGSGIAAAQRRRAAAMTQWMDDPVKTLLRVIRE